MKKIFPIIILLLVLANSLFAQQETQGQEGKEIEDEAEGEYKETDQVPTKPHYIKESELLSFSLEAIPTPTGGSFFDEYSKLGSTLNVMNDAWLPTITMYFDQTENFKISGRLSFNNFKLTDFYVQKARNQNLPVEEDNGTAAASIVENIDVTQVPVLVGVHYLPVRSQYTSYVGAQVGLSANSVKWQTINRSISNLLYLYRPAINVSGVRLSPVARIYTGFELRFDELVSKENPFRGVALEVAYFYLPMKNNYFERIINESKGAYSLPESPDATLQCGGISISLGVTLQFSKKINH